MTAKENALLLKACNFKHAKTKRKVANSKNERTTRAEFEQEQHLLTRQSFAGYQSMIMILKSTITQFPEERYVNYNEAIQTSWNIFNNHRVETTEADSSEASWGHRGMGLPRVAEPPLRRWPRSAPRWQSVQRLTQRLVQRALISPSGAKLHSALLRVVTSVAEISEHIIKTKNTRSRCILENF